jgi:predicted metal-dependent phosphoesterase TrpH
MCTVPVANRFCRESFNDPAEVYRCLKRAGMDLVTVSDHDSLDAAACLWRFPDFFASEEVSVTMPSGTRAHVAVYGIGERHHRELQCRRDDLPSLLAYCSEEGLVFGVNHMFSAVTGRRDRSDFDWFEHHFPVWESRNGAMQECANEFASALAEAIGKPVSAGSDSHTMRTLGRTFTEVPGARTAAEFLDGLRAGRGRAHGVSGDWRRVLIDVATITGLMIRERPWTLALLPVMLGIPVATFLNGIHERKFAANWARRIANVQAGQVSQPAEA